MAMRAQRLQRTEPEQSILTLVRDNMVRHRCQLPRVFRAHAAQRLRIQLMKPEPSGETVQINFRVDPAAKRQLEFLRLEIGAKSLQELLIEGMNDLFEKHGKDRIA